MKDSRHEVRVALKAQEHVRYESRQSTRRMRHEIREAREQVKWHVWHDSM